MFDVHRPLAVIVNRVNNCQCSGEAGVFSEQEQLIVKQFLDAVKTDLRYKVFRKNCVFLFVKIGRSEKFRNRDSRIFYGSS